MRQWMLMSLLVAVAGGLPLVGKTEESPRDRMAEKALQRWGRLAVDAAERVLIEEIARGRSRDSFSGQEVRAIVREEMARIEASFAWAIEAAEAAPPRSFGDPAWTAASFKREMAKASSQGLLDWLESGARPLVPGARPPKQTAASYESRWLAAADRSMREAYDHILARQRRAFLEEEGSLQALAYRAVLEHQPTYEARYMVARYWMQTGPHPPSDEVSAEIQRKLARVLVTRYRALLGSR